MMINKRVYWSFKIALMIFGVIAIFQIVPYFSSLLNSLVVLLQLTDTTPEFQIILIFVSIYLSCLAFKTIADLLFMIISLFEPKEEGGNKPK